MAVNCCVAPVEIVGLAGVTAMEVSVTAAVCTVRVVLPVTLPSVAEMVLVPAATPVARPVVLMVAIPVAEEAQLTWLVMFWVLPFE